MAEALAIEASIAAQWERLAESVQASLFLHPGYVEAIHAACSRAERWPAVGGTEGRGELELVTHHDGEELAAVAPLMRYRRLLALATHWEAPSDHGLVGGDPGAAEGVLERALGSGALRLSVPFRNAEAAGCQLLSGAAQRLRLPTAMRMRYPSFYVDLDDGFAAYERRLGRSVRKSTGRRLRRLSGAGEVRVEVVRREKELDLVLDRVLALEASGWKGSAGTAILSDPPALEFFTRAARWAARRDALRLYLLHLNGGIIAFDLGFVDREVLYLWKTGYDERLRKCSPGKMVLYLALREAAEDRIRRVELMGSPEPYKEQWATGQSSPVVLDIFARSAAGRLGRAGLLGRRRARRALGAIRRSVA